MCGVVPKQVHSFNRAHVFHQSDTSAKWLTPKNWWLEYFKRTKLTPCSYVPNWYLTMSVILDILPVPLGCHQVAILRAAETRLVFILPRRSWMLSPPVRMAWVFPRDGPKGGMKRYKWSNKHTPCWGWSGLNSGKPVEFVKVHMGHFMELNM